MPGPLAVRPPFGYDGMAKGVGKVRLGPGEIILILVAALIIFGPRRLPELGKALGRGIREFQGAVKGMGGDREPEPEEEQSSS